MRSQQVESQMYLETRNTRLLTFLATVYVPLAFVTMRSTFLVVCHNVGAESRSVFPWHEYYRVFDAFLDKLQYDKPELWWFRFCKRKLQPRQPKSSIVEYECVWQVIQFPSACNHYCSHYHWSNDQIFGPHLGILVFFSCFVCSFIGVFIDSRSSDLPERVILAILYQSGHLSLMLQYTKPFSTFHLAAQTNVA